MKYHHRLLAALVLIGAAAPSPAQSDVGKILSHPPLRPLPDVPKRPPAKGPGFFVDPARGKDDAAGSEKAPWRTINHALEQLAAGDTLYLRGGTYREQVYCAASGKPDAPITVRAYPGERAVLDGGLADFFDEPAKAWEPFPQGAADEYRSVKPYKNVRDFLGLFGDSHVALQTYWHPEDLRAENELWAEDPRQEADGPARLLWPRAVVRPRHGARPRPPRPHEPENARPGQLPR